MKKIHERQQRTITRTVEVQGVGYVTGKMVRLRFRSAPVGTGIVFVRTDLGSAACIQARVENVTGTARRTTLGQPPVSVGLVEHVLSALSGLHIDNCYVELDAPEPPGLDGSSQAFVDALQKAGICFQNGQKAIYGTDEPIFVQTQDASLAFYPNEEHGLKVSYHLDYGVFSPIVRQRFTTLVQPGSYQNEIAPCRTFLLEEEALELRRQGLGSRTQIEDLVIFDPHGPMKNRLRFGNEPARHKVLDIVGDLALLGHDLQGHVVAYRSGHPLNVEMVQVMARQIRGHFQSRRRAA